MPTGLQSRLPVNQQPTQFRALSPRRPAWPAVALALLCCLALLACGSKVVRGQAPFVDVTGWSIEGDQLSMSLRIRNVNEEELDIAGVQLAVELDSVSLLEHTETTLLTTAANGSETLNLVVTASAEGTEQLRQLQAGERNSLPYTFDGHVLTPTGQRLAFKREGHIYNVPGRPGQFR